MEIDVPDCDCQYDEKTGKGIICKNHVPEKWKELESNLKQMEALATEYEEEKNDLENSYEELLLERNTKDAEIKMLREVIAAAQNKAHILKYTKGAVSRQCQIDADKLFVMLTKALSQISAE